jgi:hypothetical protein
MARQSDNVMSWSLSFRNTTLRNLGARSAPREITGLPGRPRLRAGLVCHIGAAIPQDVDRGLATSRAILWKPAARR